MSIHVELMKNTDDLDDGLTVFDTLYTTVLNDQQNLRFSHHTSFEPMREFPECRQTFFALKPGITPFVPEPELKNPLSSTNLYLNSARVSTQLLNLELVLQSTASLWRDTLNREKDIKSDISKQTSRFCRLAEQRMNFYDTPGFLYTYKITVDDVVENAETATVVASVLLKELDELRVKVNLESSGGWLGETTPEDQEISVQHLGVIRASQSMAMAKKLLRKVVQNQEEIRRKTESNLDFIRMMSVCYENNFEDSDADRGECLMQADVYRTIRHVIGSMQHTKDPQFSQCNSQAKEKLGIKEFVSTRRVDPKLNKSLIKAGKNLEEKLNRILMSSQNTPAPAS